LFEGWALELRPGEVVAVQAPSGAGKSRLLRAIADLDPPAAGEVRLDGRTAREWGAPAWRAEVVYVAQDPADPGVSAAAWAAAVARYGAQRGRAAEDPVALGRAWGVEPALWEAPWSRLSGGERQRLALAVAVARRPRVLLLDEPTSSLDAAATAAVEAALAGRTALWVTHDVAQAARVAARVVGL
jgi:phosphate-transporting ATPase